MSSELKNVFQLIEQFEGIFDEYQQSIKKSSDAIIQNLSNAWKQLKNENETIISLENKIEKQKSELTGLKLKLEEVEKKLEDLKSTKGDLTTKINELRAEIERLNDDLNGPRLELEDLTSKLNAINEKISVKEKDVSDLEQKKLDFENQEEQLKATYTGDKLEELNVKLKQLKRNNFFTSFLMEHSEEEIPEVDIIAKIMSMGKCKLDELKQELDIPPIMAVRTIKQLAVKGIINLNEDTNEITIP